MEQTPQLGKWFHVRMVSLVALFLIVDTLFIRYSTDIIQQKGPSMMIMFAFEVRSFFPTKRVSNPDIVCNTFVLCIVDWYEICFKFV